ncbi:IS1249 family transposase [Actinomyces minihominis]|uniref:IS1249 family transposase n=1 Tax=Actinomyces minihominis TaxID=2002838 RepID=UPI002413D66F|nr:IS1249 family transposase [Actinomyces minihominis]
MGRRAVVLIARSQDYVLGWYLARTENSRAWAALMSRIAPPDVVVTDGGSGFEKARRMVWPDTVVQRCVFHAFNQIKTGTTRRPRLLAGKELYALGLRLLRLDTSEAAGVWVDDYVAWCVRWGSFLEEKTWVDGQLRLTHERLVRARNGVNRLLEAGVLFSYLDPVLCEAGVVASTNNLIEGGTNAPLRSVLRDHRGMRLMRRVKAIYWWCYMHTENPLPAAQVLKVMPTDAMIQARYDAINEVERHHRSISHFGDAIAWHELHKAGSYRIDWD